jgi:hypothetical protein
VNRLGRLGKTDFGPAAELFSIDGGLLFGRAGDEGAVTVEIAFPDGAGTLTTRVADSGFFGVAIPDAAMRTMMIEIQPGPKDPPTKDGGPFVSFVQACGRDLGGGLRREGYPNRLRHSGDGA